MKTVSQKNQEFNPNIGYCATPKNDWTHDMPKIVGRNSSEVKTDIKVHVVPRSSRNQILVGENDVFKLKVTAPPIEGKANKAVKELLAKRLGIGKGAVEIISGQRSRKKTVRIHGVSRKDLDRLLPG